MTPRHVRTLDFQQTIQAEQLCLATFLLAGRTLLAYAVRPSELLEEVSADDREIVQALLETWRQRPADPSAEFAELSAALEEVQFSLILSEPDLVSEDDQAEAVLLAQLTGCRLEDVVWTSEAGPSRQQPRS